MANPPLRFSEWYEVNGLPLATFGYAIESVSAGMPAKRGQNIVAPQLHGQIFQQKRLDSRTETWTMWVCDADPNTGVIPATDEGKNAQFIANMRTVNRILVNTRGLSDIKKISKTGDTRSITNIVRTTNVVTITTSAAHGLKAGDHISVEMDSATYDSAEVYGAKVTSVTTTPTHTITYTKSGTNITSTAATGTLGIFETLEAEAETISAIQVSDWKTLKYSTFNVEMLFPDPRWYSIHESTFSVSLASATTDGTVISGASFGSAPVTKMKIELIPNSNLEGPMTLTNNFYDGVSTKVSEIGYSQDLTGADDITIDTDELTVKLNSSTNSVQYLTRSGPSYEWFVLYPDDDGVNGFYNSVTFTTAANSTGQAKFTYKKAYFI